MRSAGTSTSLTPRKENKSFTRYLGGLFRGLFHDVANGVGDRSLEHYSLGLEASKVHTHDLARLEHHSIQNHPCARRVGPGNFTPSPSQNSGLEPLDSSGSCHPLRAAALRQNRRAPPVASWPFMVPTSIACPLRSTDITPLLRYYQAVRPSASHPFSRPRGSIHLWLLRLHRCPGSHVPYARLF
jgi:hypothetical protein